MTLAQIDYAMKAIQCRKELAELELLLKEVKAGATMNAEGSNEKAREAWVTDWLADNGLHNAIIDKRAAAESWEAVVDAIKASQRIDLIVALGGNLTDDQAIHRHIERMEEDPRVASILDDEEVLGNEHEGLR